MTDLKQQRELVSNIIDALESLHNNNAAFVNNNDNINPDDSNPKSGNLMQELIYTLIHSFRHLNYDHANTLLPKYVNVLSQLDIFTPIWENDTLEYKTDLITILIAYCSIHRSLQPLVENSIEKWDIQPVVTENLTSISYPGFYSIINQVQQFHTFSTELFSYNKFNLKNILHNSWYPLWKSYIINKRDRKEKNIQDWNTFVADNSLALLMKDESKLEFFIATTPTTNLNINNNNVFKFKFFIQRIYQKIIFFNPNSISNQIYDLAIFNVLQTNNQDNSSINNNNNNKNKNNNSNITPIKSLQFNLQVLMEIIDHPDFDFLNENQLVILLFLSLQRINGTPCNKLHETLSTLGTTQTLVSMIKIVQFIIAKYLNNIQTKADSINLNSNFTSNSSINSLKCSSACLQPNKYEIPKTLTEDILPDIPPISKSLFIFDTNENSKNNLSFIKTIDILLQCLNLTTLITNTLLENYDMFGINLFGSKDESLSDINYLLQDKFYQIYFTPTFVTLLAITHISESKIPIIPSFQRNTIKNVLISNLNKSLQVLLKPTMGTNALYHLLKFVSKISKQNLVFKDLSIILLSHLFFHGNNSVKSFCLQNKLSMRVLHDYIILWNDGSKRFSLFYKELFFEEQEKISQNQLPLISLLKLDPDNQQIIESQQLKKQALEMKGKQGNTSDGINFDTNTSAQMNNNFINQADIIPLQPIPQKNMKTYISSSKYNAYSSPVFVPSHGQNRSSTDSNKSNDFNHNNNKTHNANSPNNSTMAFTPQQPQLNLNYMFSTPPYNVDSNGTPMSTHMHTSMSSSTVAPMITSSQQNTNIDMSGGMDSFNSYSSQFSFNQAFPRPPDYINTTPNTPITSSTTRGSNNISNATSFTSPWNESPNVKLTPNGPQNKIVNTGKNYILGGHNRMKNNSRAQSIHIDQFENSM